MSSDNIFPICYNPSHTPCHFTTVTIFIIKFRPLAKHKISHIAKITKFHVLLYKVQYSLSANIKVYINNRITKKKSVYDMYFNPLNAELYPICYLLALLGVHHFLHVSRLRVNVRPCYPMKYLLKIWHRSFTFNSNKSPTWCNNFSVY
jgi:hypothetical protein